MTDPTAPAPVAAQPTPDTRDAEIAELKRQLAEAQQAQTTKPAKNAPKPAEPTHVQVLACGCSSHVASTAATAHYCEEHGLQPVVRQHEIPPEEV